MRRIASALLLVCSAGLLLADPLSKKIDVDFFRDVPSRNLKGLATRSDGRLVGGPTFAEIAAPAPADILWCLEPTSDPTHFLVGTGPDGRILDITFNAANATYGTRELVKLPDAQVFAVIQLPDGSLLAGTSPRGALSLVRDGKIVSRVLLPVDSIFDLLRIDDHTVLAATGNPGRIYRIDTAKFATVGEIADKISDPRLLADRGITEFGQIRDRNVRRIAAFPDGRIVVGSAPKGNVYVFPAAGGDPLLLQENHDAEVTDLLPQRDGSLFASIVFSATTGENRITPAATHANNPPPKNHDASEVTLPPAQPDRFSGRSALVLFPQNGFPETLTARSGVAFYRLARRGDMILIAAGDTGDLLGFDLHERLALTFPGSISAQLNDLIAIPGSADRYLVLRNNAPGLALLDFAAKGPREAETRRIDLNSPARIGAVRFNRLRDIDAKAIAIQLRASQGTDEIEGWGQWTPLTLDEDGGWRRPDLSGRSVKLRIQVPAAAAPNAPQPELDRAAVYVLPQDRRPELQDFRVLSPGYGLVVPVDQPPSPIVNLGQLIQGSRDDDKRKNAFNNTQVVPQPGAQVVLWTVTDPDGDNVSCTFSLRREGDERWTDVVTDQRDGYAQFDTSHLPDGVYFTRLVAQETAPRPTAERLSHTFETDDLVIDHTPPEIVQADAKRENDRVIVTVHGRDALSLLDSIDCTFTNGEHEVVEQPQDGIRDGREETFVLDVPWARVSNASSVEVTLYDAAGNGATRRLTWSTTDAPKPTAPTSSR